MREEAIKDFWEQNPCGEQLVLDGRRVENYRVFFREYDAFRYRTEGHILSNLDKIDFQGKNVLEVGIGQGADAQQIIERGGIYHGLDMTDEACKRVKTRFELFGLAFNSVKQGSAVSIPYPDNSFDIVYSHGVLHHIPEIEKAVREIHRVLKPEGRLIIMLYAKDSLNYRLSILILRRLLFLGLYIVDLLTLGKLIRKPLFRKHLDLSRKTGLFKYLGTANFLSRNTDGPDNPYSRVYSRNEVEATFQDFAFEIGRAHV